MTQLLLRGALLGAEWVMYLLVALSIWSIAVMLERWFFFRRHRADVDGLRSELERAASGADLHRLAGTLTQNISVEAAIVRAAIAEAPRGADAVAEILAAAQAHERTRTERGLLLLGTLGNNAPFVGLFGTVLGIIGAFHDLGANPQAGAAAVMAGISEALVATAVGLLVALPAVVGFNYFGKRANDVAQNAEVLGRTLLARCKSMTGAASQAAAASAE